MTRPARPLLCLGLAALAASCAARTYDRARAEAPLRGAMEEPLHDLSLMREAPPPLLSAAEENPFRLATGADCPALLGEIAALDAILGPDIDAARDEEEALINATQILTGAVSGALSLPYRSIIRRVTGADRRERLLRRAILAGMVRRGFLKGAARSAGCHDQIANPAPAPAGPPD